MQRAVLSFSIALGTACADNATPSDGGTPLITGQVDVTLSGYTACDQYGAKTASLGLTNPDSADYTGLECVLWTQTSGGMLWLDLVNVPAACDYSSTRPDAWRASAEITATGTLRVSLARDAADASSCTGCLHDFSLHFPTLKTAAALRLELRVADCTAAGCPATETSLLLPDRQDLAWAGAVCRYLALAGASSYRGVPTDGMRNMPAVNNGCSTGLRVAPTPFGFDVCTYECISSGTSCGPSDALTCQDGYCVLAQTW